MIKFSTVSLGYTDRRRGHRRLMAEFGKNRNKAPGVWEKASQSKQPEDRIDWRALLNLRETPGALWRLFVSNDLRQLRRHTLGIVGEENLGADKYNKGIKAYSKDRDRGEKKGLSPSNLAFRKIAFFPKMLTEFGLLGFFLFILSVGKSPLVLAEAADDLVTLIMHHIGTRENKKKDRKEKKDVLKILEISFKYLLNAVGGIAGILTFVACLVAKVLLLPTRLALATIYRLLHLLVSAAANICNMVLSPYNFLLKPFLEELRNHKLKLVAKIVIGALLLTTVILLMVAMGGSGMPLLASFPLIGILVTQLVSASVGAIGLAWTNVWLVTAAIALTPFLYVGLKSALTDIAQFAFSLIKLHSMDPKNYTMDPTTETMKIKEKVNSSVSETFKRLGQVFLEAKSCPITNAEKELFAATSRDTNADCVGESSPAWSEYLYNSPSDSATYVRSTDMGPGFSAQKFFLPWDPCEKPFFLSLKESFTRSKKGNYEELDVYDNASKTKSNEDFEFLSNSAELF